MKRAPFLGATAAVLLSGCGGSHVMRALPGVASSVNKMTGHTTAPTSFTIVPEKPDPIPDNVLANPIIGEARRFEGSIIPPNWMPAQGQILKAAEFSVLFGVLGQSGGGTGKLAFKLPNMQFSTIVAVGGSLMTSPATLAQSGRRMTARDGLGAGAIARAPKARPAVSPQTLAERRLITSAPYAGPARSIPLSPEMADRITRAEQDTRRAALAALSDANRARVDAAIQAITGGGMTIVAGIAGMTQSLTASEADALVGISDTLIRQFNDRWGGNDRRYVQLDAAQFLFSMVITREQAHAIYLRTRRRGS